MCQLRRPQDGEHLQCRCDEKETALSICPTIVSSLQRFRLLPTIHLHLSCLTVQWPVQHETASFVRQMELVQAHFDDRRRWGAALGGVHSVLKQERYQTLLLSHGLDGDQSCP